MGIIQNFLDEWPHSRTAHAYTEPQIWHLQKFTFINSDSEAVSKLVKAQKMCVPALVLKIFPLYFLFKSEQVTNFEDKDLLLLELNWASPFSPSSGQPMFLVPCQHLRRAGRNQKPKNKGLSSPMSFPLSFGNVNTHKKQEIWNNNKR